MVHGRSMAGEESTFLHMSTSQLRAHLGKVRERLYAVHREGACIMHVSRASIGVRYQDSITFHSQKFTCVGSCSSSLASARNPGGPCTDFNNMNAGQQLHHRRHLPHQHEHHRLKAESSNPYHIRNSIPRPFN